MTTIEALIARHKEIIVKLWIEAAIKTYPEQTTPFLLREKDRFANPIANILSDSLKKVIDDLAAGADGKQLAEGLDPAIRLRAVQDFTPSDAVSFIFSLKQIFRDVAGGQEEGRVEDFRQLDQKIDELALIGFDKYMECREKIFELRAGEAGNRTLRKFEKAGLAPDNQKGDA